MTVLILATCVLAPALVLLAVSEIHRRHAEAAARQRASEAERRLQAAKDAGTFKPKFGGKP